MTSLSPTDALDAEAVARWPARAATHLLGGGLTAAVLVALPRALTDLDRHQLPKETIVHLTVWLAVILVRPALPAPRLSRAVWWGLVGLVAVSALSALLSTNLWLAFRATSLTITFAAAFLTARQLAMTGQSDALLLWGALAAAAGAATGVAQAYGLDSPFFAATRVPGGTFGNRNFLAHFCALAFPLLIVTALTARRRTTRFLGSSVAAVLIGLIILTRSRTAWLGAPAGATVLIGAMWIARRRGTLILWRRAIWLGGALVLGAGLAMTLPNDLNWNSDTPYSDTLSGLANHQKGSGHGRLLQYQHSLQLALRHPLLGVGPGNWPIRYGDVAPPNDPSWIPTDVIPLNPWPSSDWMALLSERGPLAFAAVLLIGLSLCWRAWRGVMAGGARAVAGAALGAMIATALVEGTFDAVLMLAAPGFFVALTCGVLLARADGETLRWVETTPAPSRWNAALPIVLGMIALRSTTQTAAYLVAGDGRVRARTTLAAQIDPGSYPLRMALAQRGSCPDARAALKLAPLWPAPKAAVRRCGNN